MTAMRDTDKRLVESATRLRLVWMRDHIAEMLETAVGAKMTPREVLEVSSIRGARNKELMYLKTGLFINQDPEYESPVLLDMVAEAERVMGHFGIKPMMTLESVTNMRRCLPVKLPFVAV